MPLKRDPEHGFYRSAPCNITKTLIQIRYVYAEAILLSNGHTNMSKVALLGTKFSHSNISVF